jgi:hypothetical protein
VHMEIAREVCSDQPRTRSAPSPACGGGWGGGELARINLVACPLPVPPAEVGCFRLRSIYEAAELG